MKIILLPGLDGTGLLFEPLRHAFSSTIQTTVIDYPRKRRTSYDELVAQIRTRLPATEPFILLGESYGGPLSLKLAAEKPSGLCGLVLSASFITCPHSYLAKWSARLVVPSMFYLAPSLTKLKFIVDRHTTRERQVRIGKTIAAVAPVVMASRLREVININVTNELLECPVPILYLQATDDYAVPSRNLKRIQLLRPDVKAVRIKSSHMILQSQAAAAAEVIEQFANEQGKIQQRGERDNR